MRDEYGRILHSILFLLSLTSIYFVDNCLLSLLSVGALEGVGGRLLFLVLYLVKVLASYDRGRAHCCVNISRYDSSR